MRVGILTLQWANNYGALLQAHCLCSAVQQLGHKVCVMNYVPPGNGMRWWQGWGLHCGKPLLTLKRLRFNRYRRCELSLTDPCRTGQDLRSLASELDAVIVGSDQVWNGNIVRTDHHSYFLDFVDRRRCRIISYGACFGDPDQPPQTTAAAGSLLHRFHNISVRDDMSALLVQQLSGRDARIVADPILLHDGGDRGAAATGEAPYIAYYSLSHAHANLGREVVRQVQQHLGLPVVAIGNPGGAVAHLREVSSAGPSEWVRILRQAAFICTDSFHATVLASKFAKPFIAWQAVRPQRLWSFLGACGTRTRLVASADPASIAALLKTPIDYEAVAAKLTPVIVRSRAFLEEALAW